MYRRQRFTQEQKVQACNEYLNGIKSASEIGFNLGVSKNSRLCSDTILKWAKMYKVNGPETFKKKVFNSTYSKEFKKKVILEYLSGKQSILNLRAKYNISGKSTIQGWIKKYNNRIEITDYNPKPEVYMKKTLKTSYEERIEIVTYCLSHDRDIKGTAAKYGCNYAQLYQWLRKYELNGEDALLDKRGKRKQEDELTEMEKAQRKIAQLEREKEEYRMKYELLKKAEELERW
ncbi:MAG: helix-turn-helix domain-containing protein [Clostridium sp.]